MSIRDDLRQLVFGTASLPTAMPAVVSPTADPIGLAAFSVDRFDYDPGVGTNKSYYYQPASQNGRVVIVHQGHTGTLGEIGVSQLAQALLNNGFGVLVAGMPGYCGNGGSSNHNGYSSLHPFVEHVIASINHLAPTATDISMSGISGGGWTTVLCAAIDPRIKLSIPVAGSLPWHLRQANSIGDWEQAKVLDVCDYPALYALGCDSVGRRQRAIHNRYDSCCFARDGSNGAYGANYATNVAGVVNAVASVYGGEFSFVEDQSHTEHKISDWAIANAIGPLFGLAQPIDVVIDDESSGHSFVGPVGTPNLGGQTGVWTEWTLTSVGAGNAEQGDMYSAPAGSGELRSRWEFDIPAGQYEVSASWIMHSNRASNALYRVFDGAALLGMVTMDQRGTNGQVAWGVLGTFTISVGPLIVELSNESADGFVIADAARARQV